MVQTVHLPGPAPRQTAFLSSCGDFKGKEEPQEVDKSCRGMSLSQQTAESPNKAGGGEARLTGRRGHCVCGPRERAFSPHPAPPHLAWKGPPHSTAGLLPATGPTPHFSGPSSQGCEPQPAGVDSEGSDGRQRCPATRQRGGVVTPRHYTTPNLWRQTTEKTTATRAAGNTGVWCPKAREQVRRGWSCCLPQPWV